MHEYGVELTDYEDICDADCVIVAVAHDKFKEMGLEQIKKLYRDSTDEKVLIDVKGIFAVNQLKNSGMKWWRL